MLRTTLCLIATTSVLAPLAQAQIVTFGGNTDRKSSNVLFFDQGANKFMGGFNLTYGSGDWKDEYNKFIGSKTDGLMRFGSNDWATFDTSVSMTFGGVKVPAGQYFLAFASKEGKIHLALLDAAKCRKAKMAPWMPKSSEHTVVIPLKHEKADDGDGALSVTVKKDSFKLTWGPHTLTAAIEAKVMTKGVKEAAGKKGGK